MIGIGMVAFAGWIGGIVGALLAIPVLIFGPLLLLARWANSRDRRLAEKLAAEAAKRGLEVGFTSLNSRDGTAIGIDSKNSQVLVLQKRVAEVLPISSIRNMNFRYSDRTFEFLLREVDRPRLVLECLDHDSGEELEARLRAVCEAYWDQRRDTPAAATPA